MNEKIIETNAMEKKGMQEVEQETRNIDSNGKDNWFFVESEKIKAANETISATNEMETKKTQEIENETVKIDATKGNDWFFVELEETEQQKLQPEVTRAAPL